MATFTYDYTPGQTVYVVTKESYVREAVVAQLEFFTYLDSEDAVQNVSNYLVMFEDNTSATLDPTVVFGNVDDALNYAKGNITA